MNKKIIFLFFILQIFLTHTSFASSYLGKVSVIHVRESDGLIWIFINGERSSDRPSCATSNYMIIKNENSPSGKRQLAILMMAQTTNKLVYIEGAGSCTRWVDGEDINMVSIRS